MTQNWKDVMIKFEDKKRKVIITSKIVTKRGKTEERRGGFWVVRSEEFVSRTWCFGYLFEVYVGF